MNTYRRPSREALEVTYPAPPGDEERRLLERARDYRARAEHVAAGDCERAAAAVSRVAHVARARAWDRARVL